MSEGFKLLLVEDNEGLREVLVLGLEQKGYLVDEAGDGQEALQLIQVAQTEGDPYRLVITDLILPQLSGIELM